MVDSRRFQTFGWINNDWFCPGRNGGHRNPDELTRVSREYARKIVVHGFSSHGTRHTYATLLIEAGVSFNVIPMHLGYSSFKETMNTYSHVPPAMETDVIAKTQNIFQPNFDCIFIVWSRLFLYVLSKCCQPLNIKCCHTKRALPEPLEKRLFTDGAVDGT